MNLGLNFKKAIYLTFVSPKGTYTNVRQTASVGASLVGSISFLLVSKLIDEAK
jgi:hypothetical protein